MPTNKMIQIASDCDDQVFVLSTLGQGPKGEKGDTGDARFPTFADPIEWDINRKYDEFTLVLNDGKTYVSRQAVPLGISISNGNYWALANNYDAQVTDIAQRLASVSEDVGSLQASLPDGAFDGNHTVKGYVDQKDFDMKTYVDGEIDDTNDTIDSLRDTMEDDYVPFPESPNSKYGTANQVLSTLTNGKTEWVNPVNPSDAQAETYITAWLNDHPEATTTVLDGSITDLKLAQTGGVLEEVHDIRAGVDGTVYTSAGDAVRGQITGLKAEINDLYNSFDDTGIRLYSDYETVPLTIDTNNKWASQGGNVLHIAIKVKPSDIVHILLSGSSTYYAVLRSYNPVAGQDADVSIDADFSSRILISSGVDTVLTMPSDANYFIFWAKIGPDAFANPSVFEINGYSILKNVIDNLDDVKDKLETSINATDAKVEATDAKVEDITKKTIGKYVAVDDASDFPNAYTYSYDGTKTTETGIYRPSTDFIDVDGYTRVDYKLCELVDSNYTLNIISFFDSNKTYISGVVSTASGYVEGSAAIPNNAKYVVGSWLTFLTQTPSIVLVNESALAAQIDVLEQYHEREQFTEVVNPLMTKAQFVTAVNAAFASYVTLCKCKSYCMLPLNATMEWNTLYNTINMNLRQSVCNVYKSFSENCYAINKALTEPIYRYVDAKLNTTNNIDFSLNTGFDADEPSAIVSEDGQTLYIYAHLKRISTVDGLNWSSPIDTPITGGPSYIMHNNVNLINGVYYMIGTSQATNGGLHLFTSTDGINFAYAGLLFDDVELSDGYTPNYWGNSTLYYEPGEQKYYLYVESASSATNGEWRIDLATCTDILHSNANGTIGNWVISDNNPMLYKPLNTWAPTSYNTAGNPDFIKGSDNQPVRHEGKYYLQFHSTWQQVAHILRASTRALDVWEVDGILLDNRDTPSGGDTTSGNADSCIIEFKGKTYLFYTWDINNYPATPYIKYMIDNRLVSEMIQLRP